MRNLIINLLFYKILFLKLKIAMGENTRFKRHKNKWGTPTTIVLAGSSAVDYVEGETIADDLKKLYEKYFDIDAYKNN